MEHTILPRVPGFPEKCGTAVEHRGLFFPPKKRQVHLWGESLRVYEEGKDTTLTNMTGVLNLTPHTRVIAPRRLVNGCDNLMVVYQCPPEISNSIPIVIRERTKEDHIERWSGDNCLKLQFPTRAAVSKWCEAITFSIRVLRSRHESYIISPKASSKRRDVIEEGWKSAVANMTHMHDRMVAEMEVKEETDLLLESTVMENSRAANERFELQRQEELRITASLSEATARLTKLAGVPSTRDTTTASTIPEQLGNLVRVIGDTENAVQRKAEEDHAHLTSILSNHAKYSVEKEVELMNATYMMTSADRHATEDREKILKASKTIRQQLEAEVTKRTEQVLTLTADIGEKDLRLDTLRACAYDSIETMTSVDRGTERLLESIIKLKGLSNTGPLEGCMRRVSSIIAQTRGLAETMSQDLLHCEISNHVDPLLDARRALACSLGEASRAVKELLVNTPEDLEETKERLMAKEEMVRCMDLEVQKLIKEVTDKDGEVKDLEDRMKVKVGYMEKSLREAEERVCEAEGKARGAEERVCEAEAASRSAEARVCEAEKRALEAEKRVCEAEAIARDGAGKIAILEAGLCEAEAIARDGAGKIAILEAGLCEKTVELDRVNLLMEDRKSSTTSEEVDRLTTEVSKYQNLCEMKDIDIRASVKVSRQRAAEIEQITKELDDKEKDNALTLDRLDDAARMIENYRLVIRELEEEIEASQHHVAKLQEEAKFKGAQGTYKGATYGSKPGNVMKVEEHERICDTYVRKVALLERKAEKLKVAIAATNTGATKDGKANTTGAARDLAVTGSSGISDSSGIDMYRNLAKAIYGETADQGDAKPNDQDDQVPADEATPGAQAKPGTKPMVGGARGAQGGARGAQGGARAQGAKPGVVQRGANTAVVPKPHILVKGQGKAVGGGAKAAVGARVQGKTPAKVQARAVEVQAVEDPKTPDLETILLEVESVREALRNANVPCDGPLGQAVKEGVAALESKQDSAVRGLVSQFCDERIYLDGKLARLEDEENKQRMECALYWEELQVEKESRKRAEGEADFEKEQKNRVLGDLKELIRKRREDVARLTAQVANGDRLARYLEARTRKIERSHIALHNKCARRKILIKTLKKSIKRYQTDVASLYKKKVLLEQSLMDLQSDLSDGVPKLDLDALPVAKPNIVCLCHAIPTRNGRPGYDQNLEFQVTTLAYHVRRAEFEKHEMEKQMLAAAANQEDMEKQILDAASTTEDLEKQLLDAMACRADLEKSLERNVTAEIGALKQTLCEQNRRHQQEAERLRKDRDGLQNEMCHLTKEYEQAVDAYTACHRSLSELRETMQSIEEKEISARRSMMNEMKDDTMEVHLRKLLGAQVDTQKECLEHEVTNVEKQHLLVENKLRKRVSQLEDETLRLSSAGYLGERMAEIQNLKREVANFKRENEMLRVREAQIRKERDWVHDEREKAEEKLKGLEKNVVLRSSGLHALIEPTHAPTLIEPTRRLPQAPRPETRDVPRAGLCKSQAPQARHQARTMTQGPAQARPQRPLGPAGPILDPTRCQKDATTVMSELITTPEELRAKAPFRRRRSCKSGGHNDAGTYHRQGRRVSFPGNASVRQVIVPDEPVHTPYVPKETLDVPVETLDVPKEVTEEIDVHEDIAEAHEVPNAPEHVPDELPNAAQHIADGSEVPDTPEDTPVDVPAAPEDIANAPEDIANAPVDVPDAPVDVPDAPVDVPDAPVDVPDADVTEDLVADGVPVIVEVPKNTEDVPSTCAPAEVKDKFVSSLVLPVNARRIAGVGYVSPAGARKTRERTPGWTPGASMIPQPPRISRIPESSPSWSSLGLGSDEGFKGPKPSSVPQRSFGLTALPPWRPMQSTGLKNSPNPNPGFKATPNPSFKATPNPGFKATQNTGLKNSPNTGLKNAGWNTGLKNTPNTGLKNTPNTGLKNSPNTGLKNSPNTGLKNSPNTGLKNSPNTGLKNGPNTGLKNSPNTGLKNGPNAGLKNSPNTGLKNAGWNTGLTNTPNMRATTSQVPVAERKDSDGPTTRALERAAARAQRSTNMAQKAAEATKLKSQQVHAAKAEMLSAARRSVGCVQDSLPSSLTGGRVTAPRLGEPKTPQVADPSTTRSKLKDRVPIWERTYNRK